MLNLDRNGCNWENQNNWVQWEVVFSYNWYNSVMCNLGSALGIFLKLNRFFWLFLCLTSRQICSSLCTLTQPPLEMVYAHLYTTSLFHMLISLSVPWKLFFVDVFERVLLAKNYTYIAKRFGHGSHTTHFQKHIQLDIYSKFIFKSTLKGMQIDTFYM